MKAEGLLMIAEQQILERLLFQIRRLARPGPRFDRTSRWSMSLGWTP